MAVSYAALTEIVRRNFERNLIAGCDFNKMLAHTAGDVSQKLVAVFKFDAIHCGGKNLHHSSCDFN